MSGEPLLGVADAVSAGAAVNWATASDGLDEADRAVLRELRALADLAALHADPAGSSASSSASSTTSDGPLAAATTWGDLKLVESIGEGAFGHVFRAWDPQLDREVALKLLHPDVVPGAISEGRLLARVKHPNVVAVYAADERDGQVGLSMEFIRGRTLASLIEALGPFGARETVGVGIDLCRALAAVHGAGLVHRDVKAQNVMRESGGRIVLMDFGASAGSASSPGLVGTPLYLAPELLAGQPATTASDLYSVGVLLFHLLTNSYPIVATSVGAMIDAHRAGKGQRLRDLRPDLPEPLVAILERATHAAPAKRFSSAGAMEEALIGSLQEHTSPARTPAWRARLTPARVIAGLALVVGLAIGAAHVPRLLDRPTAGHLPAFASIAVLPIQNLTGDASRDYLADGLTEGLAGRLSRIPSLAVISHRSSLAYRNASKTPSEIAKELNVEMLLDGSIRPTPYSTPEGPRLQFTTSLVDPQSGRTVWTGTEQQVPSSSQRVEQALFELLEFEIRGAFTPPRPDIDDHAYDDYLRGRSQWNKRTSDAMLKARDLFARAIEREPRFAAAHAGLADAYLLLGAFGWLPGSDVFPKAEASAKQAIALDASLAAPHATLGYLFANESQWPPSEREFERAIALDPNYATARHWYALSLMSHNIGAAVAEIERARDLDPLSEIIGSDAAVVYKHAGRDDDAIEQLRRVIRVHPHFAEGHRQLAEFLEQLHRYPEALSAFEAGVKADPQEPRLLAGLASAYGRAGRVDEARSMYRQLRDETGTRFIPLAMLAMAAVGAGDLDGAVDYCRRGVRDADRQLVDTLVTTDFTRARLAALDERPEFTQLVRDAKALRKQ